MPKWTKKITQTAEKVQNFFTEEWTPAHKEKLGEVSFLTQNLVNIPLHILIELMSTQSTGMRLATHFMTEYGVRTLVGMSAFACLKIKSNDASAEVAKDTLMYGLYPAAVYTALSTMISPVGFVTPFVLEVGAAAGGARIADEVRKRRPKKDCSKKPY